tara:strand:+ start:6370 stop:6951 length:582 start_codon:yes stop_codon:yes gene_type:complete
MKLLEVLIFLGPPGSGKGTQAELLNQKINFTHLSVGDLLRDNISDNTELGKLASNYVRSGELVPDDLIIGLMDSYISNLKNNDNSLGIILDGFPRTINQAVALEKKMSQLGVTIKVAINLDITDEKILSRLEERGREDDKPGLIKNRLSVYRNQTKPLLDFYSKRNLLESVNGDQSMEAVSNEIINLFRTKVA